MGSLRSFVERMFENDPVTAFFVIFLIILIILGIWLFRSRTKGSRSPDILDHDGYYRITHTPVGYSETGSHNLFGTMSTFYYLRKDPFDIEVALDNIAAADGKKYRARAVVTAVMPYENIDKVCRRYFDGQMTNDNITSMRQILNGRSKADSAEEILHKKTDVAIAEKILKNGGKETDADIVERILKNGGKETDADIVEGILKNNSRKPVMNPDELFHQAIVSQSAAKSVPFSRKRSSDSHEKNNCDADIDIELTIAFSSALKKLVEENGGNMSEEEIKKKFFNHAMLGALSSGHTVTGVSAFDIVEIAE